MGPSNPVLTLRPALGALSPDPEVGAGERAAASECSPDSRAESAGSGEKPSPSRSASIRPLMPPEHPLLLLCQPFTSLQNPKVLLGPYPHRAVSWPFLPAVQGEAGLKWRERGGVSSQALGLQGSEDPSSSVSNSMRHLRHQDDAPFGAGAGTRPSDHSPCCSAGATALGPPYLSFAITYHLFYLLDSKNLSILYLLLAALSTIYSIISNLSPLLCLTLAKQLILCICWLSLRLR